MNLLLINRVLAFTETCLLAITIMSAQNSFAADANSEMNAFPFTDEARQQILKWNLKTLVQAYEQVGHTNLAWDTEAKAALTEFALASAQIADTNGSWQEIISKNVLRAARAGCDDPLLTYLRLRNAPADRYDDTFAQFVNAATGLHNSSYPSVRKFYADARALYHLDRFDKGSPALAAIRAKILPWFINDLEATLRDKSMPAHEAYEVANLTLTLMENEGGNYKFATSWIHTFYENWGDDYTAYLLKGKTDIQLAWIARGNGYADTVTEEGWKNFNGYLAAAREALEHAWLLNSEDAEIADAMMTVVLGEAGKLPALDLWFDRAMTVNTNNYEACRKRLNYLEPKWYGSDEQQLAFGRWCAKSIKWGGRVPLVLLDAHNAINSRNAEAAQSHYWNQPDVWSDVQISLNRFFELNPNAVDMYQTYALYAYKAAKWDKLNELIPKLKTNVNYELFGGKAEFDKMVQLAKEHGNPKN